MHQALTIRVVLAAFVWAGDQLLSETTTDEAGEVLEVRDFLFLPGSFTPLAQRVNGAAYCCHTDFRGAPTRLTDDAGQVAWAAAYSAYGEAHPRKERLRQPLRLPGQYHDHETGLHQNRWRSFDPHTARYLSPDPLGLAGGLNLYAYAEQDPINQTDPLGLFPGIEDLTAHVLGAKSGAQASQAYGQVQNLLHTHLSAATPPFLPTGPSPFGPNGLGSLPGMKPLGAALPTYNLPGLPAPVNLGSLNAGSLFNQGINGPLPLGHLHAQHTKHHAPAHHAPPPAQAANACTPKPLPAHRHTPRPAPLPSDTTPIITVRDFFGGIGTGFRNIWDFRRGTEQASEDMVNPVKIYQGTQALGGQLADVLVADPDGHKASGSALARNMGHGFVESINPFDKKNAYDVGYSTGNLVVTAVPVVGEAGALNDLRLGLKAATVSRDAAEAGLKGAQTVPEQAAAAARLQEAEERVAQVQAALKEHLPGVKAVKKVKEVSAKVKQKASTAKAAAKTAQERRHGRAAPVRREGDPHTEESLTKAKADEARMHERWEKQGHHTGQRPPALAYASEAPGTKSTAAIGMPGGKPGMMRMARQKGASKSNGTRSTSQVPRPPRWRDTIPVGGDKAIHATLQSEVERLRARIRDAGLVDDSKGTLNGNLAAAKVIMKNGTSKTFYSYSSMNKLSKPTRQIAAGLAKDPNLARMFVEDSIPHVQTKVGFGYPNHTEPRLLNYILSKHDVNDIAEVHLFTERPPCDGSCGPYVLQSWRNGQWQAVPWQPPQGSVVVPETQSIPLYVYDANGDRW